MPDLSELDEKQIDTIVSEFSDKELWHNLRQTNNYGRKLLEFKGNTRTFNYEIDLCISSVTGLPAKLFWSRSYLKYRLSIAPRALNVKRFHPSQTIYRVLPEERDQFFGLYKRLSPIISDIYEHYSELKKRKHKKFFDLITTHQGNCFCVSSRNEEKELVEKYGKDNRVVFNGDVYFFISQEDAALYLLENG